MANLQKSTAFESNEKTEWSLADVSTDLLHSWIGRPIELQYYSRQGTKISYIADSQQRLSIPNPSIIYIVEIDFYRKPRIKAWFKEYLIDKNDCNDSDHSNNDDVGKNRRRCWVCRWLILKPKWILRLISEHEQQQLAQEIRYPCYYRICGDWHEYDPMDMIDIVQRYPVWINENLFTSNELQLCCQRLTKIFYEINDIRQDHHPYPSPVEDIVDPDLLIYRPNIPLIPNTSLRNSYQWIPSKFLINNKTHAVKIISPICHLENYNGIYDDIASVFSAMLPMFQEIQGFDWYTESIELQVVIKVQSYNMKPGMQYSGRWHTEGQTENIRAVGVVYLDFDRYLQGGALKFRSQEATAYRLEDHEIDVHTGAAIVFENCIPHRFRQIQNRTNMNRRRTFINFFLIDPTIPINLDSTQICFCYKDQLREILKSFGRTLSTNTDQEDNRRSLPDLVEQKILSYLPNLWNEMDEAKRFRYLARQEMLQQKSGWGWIQFGNSGIVHFIKQASDDTFELRHTESD